MTDQSPLFEQTVAEPSRSISQINEILLLLAQRQQEHDRGLQEIRETLRAVTVVQRETADQQRANVQQIAVNAQAIAELRALFQDRYSDNGHGGD